MFDEEIVQWATPRPSYMREMEPLAVPEAWHSRITKSEVGVSAKINRDLFEQGKITADSYERRATRIVLGKSA